MENQTTQKKPRKPRLTRDRPDGTNDKDYESCETWLPKRWAWEFLRRNPQFILESQEAQGKTDVEQQKIAEKYGLRRFKPASEKYRGAHGVPIFLGASIQSWTNWDESLRQISKIKLKHSQVLILFDLETTMADRRLLRVQLQQAEMRLRERLQALEEMREKKAAVQRPKSPPLRLYLRLLDLKYVAKKKLVDSFLIANPMLRAEFQQNPVAARIDANHRASNSMKSAMRYANKDYRFLAAMVQKKSSLST